MPYLAVFKLLLSSQRVIDNDMMVPFMTWYNVLYTISLLEALFLEALEVAHRAVEAAGAKQAVDILLLDTKEVCSFADYFVICSSDSERQAKAIYEEVGYSLKKAGVLPHHHEGTVDSGWLLIDFGDVIVHIFTSIERERYQLDRLWERADTIIRIQ